MTKKKPFRFLALPPELRLEVYGHPLTDTLANGRTSDAGGLYLACQTTQSEIQPLVSTVRLALDFKLAWNHESSLESGVKGKLSFEIPPSHTYSTPLTQIAVWFPPTPEHVPRYTRAKRKTTKLAILGLRRFFLLFNVSLKGRHSSASCLEMQNFFFFFLSTSWGLDFMVETAETRKIDRMVFWKDGDEPRWIVQIVHATECVESLVSSGVSSWISEEMVGGRVRRSWGLDFKGGLPVPGGKVVWGSRKYGV